MKLRDILGMAGIRKSPRTYSFEVEEFKLEKDGDVRFAQWLHPKCGRTILRQSELDELRRYLKPGSAVIDIGAHTGDTSVLFALAVGASGRVLAVEPNRYLHHVLKENAKLNPQAAPIDVLPYAATSEAARLTFRYSDEGFCNGGDLDRFGSLRHGHTFPLEVEGRNILVELERNHPEWISRVALIKTDTEGNDPDVIATLRELIVRQKPFIVAEVYKRSPAAQRVEFFQLMEELGYDMHLAEPWRELAGPRLSADDMSRHSHFDVFCVPRDHAA